MNCVLILNGWFWLIEVLQVKPFNAASATLEGIEVAHIIRIQAICGSRWITVSS
jgi:putative transposase